MYSDGLVERRGELLSSGMDRLARLTTAIVVLRRLDAWSNG